MSQYDYDIAVLGGGAAGLTVVAGSAQAGAKTLLIEKEGRLGGDCLYYGCVPSKTLIRTAQVARLIRTSENFGLPAIELPPVDFEKVAARIQSVISRIQEHDSEERFCKLGAKVLYGDAQFIDEHAVRLNGQIYSAHTWVIATGSSPAVPPIEGIDTTACLTNKDVFSLKKLPRSMVILGGGPIGIEFAQAFSRLGAKVYVVERLGTILGFDDEDMTSILREILEAEGIQFYLDSGVVRVNDLGNEKEVIFKKGNETKNILAEALVVATGRKANLSGLGIESIGVATERRGLKLDARLRTTQKHIYGAGDVTGTHQFTHAAGYEGGIVVSNAIFHIPRKVNYTYFPWVTYTDPELANIGMNEKAAKAAGIRYTVWTEEFRNNDRSLAEGALTGKIKMLLDDREKPIGIQILGPHAGDLISEWVAILNGNTKLSKVASSIHPYPTLGEINKRVAGAYIAPKIFSEKVRKGLRFFFHFKGRACGDPDTEK
ncbi:MAG: FAD-dependent oxidoreductase [Thermodesulfovibrionales bacterium]|nr:FAD-dependent oxidoreductase [Thermodesulfovibrionales bacterium]